MTVFGDIPIPIVSRFLPRLKERAELLYAPPIDVQVELIARDRDGRVTGRRKFRSHSFVSNFVQWMFAEFNTSGAAGTATTTGKDIGGTTRTFKVSSINVAAGLLSSPTSLLGTGANIVVGTSSTAPAFSDNVLGGFAGRAFAAFSAPVLAATTKFTVTASVSFTTATTINEVGIDLPIAFDSTISAGVQSFLLVHDNVSGGFAVSAGGTITVVYTIQVTT